MGEIFVIWISLCIIMNYMSYNLWHRVSYNEAHFRADRLYSCAHFVRELDR